MSTCASPLPFPPAAQSTPTVSRVLLPNASSVDYADDDVPDPGQSVPNQESDQGFGPENVHQLQQDAISTLNLSGSPMVPTPRHRELSEILNVERTPSPPRQRTAEDEPIRRVSA